jgi:inosine triphosphate pyrophosphatase
MKPKLYIVTGSSMKFKELSLRLNEFFDCEQRDWSEHEIQGTSEEIIKHKLARAYEIFKHPVLVDDVAVHFDELNGFPGPYMKDFLKCFSSHEMGAKFAGTRMSASCFLGLCRGDGDILIVEGKIDGQVVMPKQGEHHGRHFDIFLQPDGKDKPMIEFTPEEKNEFSHRGLAMKKLIEALKKENK